MTYYNVAPPDSIIVDWPLTPANTRYFVSEWLSYDGSVNVADYQEAVAANSAYAVDFIYASEIYSVDFSIPQSNIEVSLANNLIWIRGYYNLDQYDGFYYFDPPYGNDIQNTANIVGDPPQRKLLWKVKQSYPTGAKIGHQILANITSKVATPTPLFVIAERFVEHDIYYAYQILLEYDWYAECYWY